MCSAPKPLSKYFYYHTNIKYYIYLCILYSISYIMILCSLAWDYKIDPVFWFFYFIALKLIYNIISWPCRKVMVFYYRTQHHYYVRYNIVVVHLNHDRSFLQPSRLIFRKYSVPTLLCTNAKKISLILNNTYCYINIVLIYMHNTRY